MTHFMYASYPTAKLYANKGDKKNIHELLWGDWVKITGPQSDDWFPVHARGTDGWMKASDLQDERLLEIVFVDVGQGDGSLVVTPEDKHMVIDAGLSDNMYRFLRWRYGGFKNRWDFEAAVITHPDQDHYSGFTRLFEDENVFFDNVYHNGIIETKGTTKESLGHSADMDGPRYIIELMEDQQALSTFLNDNARWKGKRYPGLLNKAFSNGRVTDIKMLSADHGDAGYMPGYTPDKALSIRVMGPVPDTDTGGKARLRWFKKFDQGSYDKGQTKNGHSIVLKIQYHDISIILGGDLNWAAEHYLLENYVGRQLPEPACDPDEQTAFIFLAREKFECDVLKCCHHGSADFMNLFLSATNPVATVVSSGDEEPYAHPRSDTLGAIGKYGRGQRPLIFSTELARSTRERESPELQDKLIKTQIAFAAATSDIEKQALRKELDEITHEIMKRNVTVYGAINLRTDGHKVIMAQKLEEERSAGYSLQKWDVYQLEPDEHGCLQFIGEPY